MPEARRLSVVHPAAAWQLPSSARDRDPAPPPSPAPVPPPAFSLSLEGGADDPDARALDEGDRLVAHLVANGLPAYPPQALDVVAFQPGGALVLVRRLWLHGPGRATAAVTLIEPRAGDRDAWRGAWQVYVLLGGRLEAARTMTVEPSEAWLRRREERLFTAEGELAAAGREVLVGGVSVRRD